MQRKSFSGYRLAFVALFLASLGAGNAAAGDGNIPVWPAAEWQIATPEQEGMNSAELAKLVAFGKQLRLDSLLIARHGRLVLDAYYAPYNAELPHVVNSTTKAVVGTLIAMLLKDGLLDSLDHPVLDLFAGREVANVDERKKAITIRHLLNMTSGLDWDEGLGGGKEQSLQDLGRSPDWVQYILDRPMAHAPGETFYYNSGGSHLLSAVITKLTGKSAADYANEKLFGPLGIAPPSWRRDPQGLSTGGFGLWLKPRDMAKFGYLYLRGGTWRDQQLLPPDWIEAVNHPTTDMRTSFEPGLRYADQFWALPDRHMYMAVGYHCQVVMVLPDQDIVAVMTARDFCPFRRLTETIVAAVASDSALPPAPGAAASLSAAISEAATETSSDPGVPSEIVSAVSGKTYDFPPNTLNFKSMALFLKDPDPHVTWELYQADAPNGVVRTESPIGLDGLYRMNAPKNPTAPFAYRAMKGAWRDGKTFVVDLQFIGMGEERRWGLTFDGERLTIKAKGRDGRDVVIEGKVTQLDKTPG
jgi:CubicO group peptidase (beta-lactamase class C family)